MKYSVLSGSLAVVVAVVVCGCGSRVRTYSVQGTVTAQDATPLEGVQVIWQCADPPLTATAITDASGRYRLGTFGTADGAPAGEYQVALSEPQPDDPDARPPNRIDPRYSSFDTSGLRYTVEPRSNRIDIQLEPVGSPTIGQ